MSKHSGLSLFASQLRLADNRVTLLPVVRTYPVFSRNSWLANIPCLGAASVSTDSIRLPEESPSPFSATRFAHEAGFSIHKKLLQHPDARFILFSAEDQISSYLANLPCHMLARIYPIFHQPPSWHERNWKNNSILSRFSALVVFGESQQKYFESISSAPCLVIKHGVDALFFRPSSSSLKFKGGRLLFVGQWLRDFETLYYAYKIISEKRRSVSLDCVIPKRLLSNFFISKLSRLPGVRFHIAISPAKLLSLYQNCDLLLLPLIDSVANNAIVESLSCGLPVVSSRVGSVPEYLPGGAGVLLPVASPDHFARAVLELFNAPQKLISARIIARNYALSELSWKRSSRKLLNLVSER